MLARRVAHVALAVDDARNRHRRHAGVARDFVNRDGAALAASGSSPGDVAFRRRRCDPLARSIDLPRRHGATTGALHELAITIDSTRCQSPIPHELPFPAGSCRHRRSCAGSARHRPWPKMDMTYGCVIPPRIPPTMPGSTPHARELVVTAGASATLQAAERELLEASRDSRASPSRGPDRSRNRVRFHRDAAQFSGHCRPAAGDWSAPARRAT